jgi:hypothetical protein
VIAVRRKTASSRKPIERTPRASCTLTHPERGSTAEAGDVSKGAYSTTAGRGEGTA